MHKALLGLQKSLENHILRENGVSWTIKKDKDHLIIVYTPPGEGKAVFGANVHEVYNPLNPNESIFMMNCWGDNFHWAHSFSSSDESHSNWEINNFIKLLTYIPFDDKVNSNTLKSFFLESPDAISSTAIYGFKRSKKNSSISNFSSIGKENYFDWIKINQRRRIERNRIHEPITIFHEPGKDDVLKEINRIYKSHYIKNEEKTREKGNHLTSLITKEWQSSLVVRDSKRFLKEYPVDSTNQAKQLIDLVDLENAIAYELKVSENNVHHEFYKDVFKILLANSKEFKFKKFIFITSKKMLPPLADFSKSIAKEFNLEIEVFLLDN